MFIFLFFFFFVINKVLDDACIISKMYVRTSVKLYSYTWCVFCIHGIYYVIALAISCKKLNFQHAKNVSISQREADRARARAFGRLLVCSCVFTTSLEVFALPRGAKLQLSSAVTFRLLTDNLVIY